jgi:hypothetical protein
VDLPLLFPAARLQADHAFEVEQADDLGEEQRVALGAPVDGLDQLRGRLFFYKAWMYSPTASLSQPVRFTG